MCVCVCVCVCVFLPTSLPTLLCSIDTNIMWMEANLSEMRAGDTHALNRTSIRQLFMSERIGGGEGKRKGRKEGCVWAY